MKTIKTLVVLVVALMSGLAAASGNKGIQDLAPPLPGHYAKLPPEAVPTKDVDLVIDQGALGQSLVAHFHLTADFPSSFSHFFSRDYVSSVSWTVNNDGEVKKNLSFGTLRDGFEITLMPHVQGSKIVGVFVSFSSCDLLSTKLTDIQGPRSKDTEKVEEPSLRVKIGSFYLSLAKAEGGSFTLTSSALSRDGELKKEENKVIITLKERRP